MSNDVSPLAILVPILDNRTDDIAENPESALGGTQERPGLVAHRHDRVVQLDRHHHPPSLAPASCSVIRLTAT